MQVQAKNIVITGASRRLGLFLTEQFLKRGDNVIAVTRSPSQDLQRLDCDRLKVVTLTGDYDASTAQQLVEQVSSLITCVDVVIHNASVFKSDQDVEHDLTHHYAALFNIHMAFPAQLNIGLHPLLVRSQDACIVHITDIYAENPKTDFALYCSTKAGLENLSKGFSKKFAPDVRVNTIQPGPIQFLPEHSEEQKASVLSQTLLKKEGGFEPVYIAVKSLIENPFMTGASIAVDGGRSIHSW